MNVWVLIAVMKLSAFELLIGQEKLLDNLALDSVKLSFVGLIGFTLYNPSRK